MRHLFGKPYLSFGDDGAEMAYRNLLNLRYSSGSLPGAPGFDAISRLNLRIPDTPSNMPSTQHFIGTVACLGYRFLFEAELP